MLGKTLRKQWIPVCILQRNSWPFTNMPLCFLAPALLTSQTGNCVFPVAADHVLGTGRAGLSPHPPLLAVPWDHGTALLASLEFLLFFQILTLSGFFHHIVLIKASCFACTCFYSQAVSQARCGYFPKPPFPHQADCRQQKYPDPPLDGASVHKSLPWDYKCNSLSTRNENEVLTIY